MMYLLDKNAQKMKRNNFKLRVLFKRKIHKIFLTPKLYDIQF